MHLFCFFIVLILKRILFFSKLITLLNAMELTISMLIKYSVHNYQYNRHNYQYNNCHGHTFFYTVILYNHCQEHRVWVGNSEDPVGL